jgi:lactoylglutathione lyase
MSFCWTTINVNQMEESLTFYQDVVGLELSQRFPAGPGVEIAFLGEGETKLELIDDEKKKSVQVGEDLSLGFDVASLDEKIDFVKSKGISIHSGPFQPNAQIKYFFVLDPNGVKIQFVDRSL